MNCLFHSSRLPLILILAVYWLCVSIPVTGQTVIDLDSIEADTTIIGSGYRSSLKNAVILDIDNSGTVDLFLRDAAFQETYGDECVFGYLDFSSRHGVPVVDVIEKHDIVIVSNPSVNKWLGFSLATGDWNHDGVDDLAVGDPTADQFLHIAGGTVDVFWGGSRWQAGMIIDLSQESSDIFIYSSNMSSEDDWLGTSLASADLNNDGIDDLVIGEKYGPNQTGSGTGAVYVLYGSEDFTTPMEIDLALDGADLTLHGRYGGDRFGESLAVGDVNGDQIDDLVVGAWGAWYWESEWLRLGAMYAFFGSDSFPPQHHIDLSESEADVTVLGNQHHSAFGDEVVCGDFNGDGVSDLCGGQYSYNTAVVSIGAAYLVWGREGFTPQTLIDLRSEPADVSFYGDGLHQFALGRSLSAGDLNGDGKDELCLSSWKSTENDEAASGGHHIFLGASNYPPFHSVELSETYPTLRILGKNYLDATNTFSTIADINNDGHNDILIGHSGVDRPEVDDCGAIYIFYSDGLPVDRPPRVMAGPGPHVSNPSEMRLWDPFYNANGVSDLFYPYLVQGYGLNPAAGDLNGDGYDEILVGPGPGPHHPPTVLALDTVGGSQWSIQAYGTPRYGVTVTAGDLDGDGDDEVITGAGPGAVYGPHVRGWDLSGGQILPLGNVSFLAYGTNRWGVNVACGDIDGDGKEEIITGAGPGAVFGPHVRGWDVEAGAAGPISAVSYFAYGTLRWGVNVASGDIDGDGIDEIVTGPGPSEIFGSHVRGWNYDGEVITSISGVNFFSHSDLTNSMGCVVACGDLDNDHIDEILTAPGPHPENPAQLKSWNYDGEVLTQIDRMSFMLFEEEEYVAGARLAIGNFYQAPPFLP